MNPRVMYNFVHTCIELQCGVDDTFSISSCSLCSLLGANCRKNLKAPMFQNVPIYFWKMPPPSCSLLPMSDTSVSESKEKGVNKIENNFILTGEQHISISPISRLPIFWCGSSGVGLCIFRPFLKCSTSQEQLPLVNVSVLLTFIPVFLNNAILLLLIGKSRKGVS